MSVRLPHATLGTIHETVAEVEYNRTIEGIVPILNGLVMDVHPNPDGLCLRIGWSRRFGDVIHVEIRNPTAAQQIGNLKLQRGDHIKLVGVNLRTETRDRQETAVMDLLLIKGRPQLERVPPKDTQAVAA